MRERYYLRLLGLPDSAARVAPASCNCRAHARLGQVFDTAAALGDIRTSSPGPILGCTPDATGGKSSCLCATEGHATARTLLKSPRCSVGIEEKPLFCRGRGVFDFAEFILIGSAVAR